MGFRSKTYSKYKKTIQKGGLWEMERLGYLSDPQFREQFKNSMRADVLRINRNLMDESWRSKQLNIMDSLLEKETLISNLEYLNMRYRKPSKKNSEVPKKNEPVKLLPPIE